MVSDCENGIIPSLKPGHAQTPPILLSRGVFEKDLAYQSSLQYQLVVDRHEASLAQWAYSAAGFAAVEDIALVAAERVVEAGIAPVAGFEWVATGIPEAATGEVHPTTRF